MSRIEEGGVSGQEKMTDGSKVKDKKNDWSKVERVRKETSRSKDYKTLSEGLSLKINKE